MLYEVIISILVFLPNVDSLIVNSEDAEEAANVVEGRPVPGEDELGQLCTPLTCTRWGCPGRRSGTRPPLPSTTSNRFLSPSKPPSLTHRLWTLCSADSRTWLKQRVNCTRRRTSDRTWKSTLHQCHPLRVQFTLIDLNFPWLTLIYLDL